MASYIVRHAIEADCPAILRLFKEQEDLDPNGLKSPLSLETLKTYGFGNPEGFTILVAETTPHEDAKKDIIGYVFYHAIYCTWRGKSLLVEDIYVVPEYRSKGVAKKMGRLVCKIALEHDFCQVQWYIPGNDAKLVDLSTLIGAENQSKIDSYYYYQMSKSTIVKWSNCTKP